MKSHTRVAANKAAIWAIAFSIGVVVGPIAIAIFLGDEVSVDLVTGKLILAAGSLPVVFFILWGWAVASSREPTVVSAFQPGARSDDNSSPGGNGDATGTSISPLFRKPAIQNRNPAQEDATIVPANERVMESDGGDRFQRIVAMELSLKRRDGDLWAQASLQAGGDQNATRATYVRLRVERLSEFARRRRVERNGTPTSARSVLPDGDPGVDVGSPRSSIPGRLPETGPIEAADSPDDEQLWERALLELEGNNRRAGIWAKALAESGGNESAARAAYLRQRVAQLARERAVAGGSGARP